MSPSSCHKTLTLPSVTANTTTIHESRFFFKHTTFWKAIIFQTLIFVIKKTSPVLVHLLSGTCVISVVKAEAAIIPLCLVLIGNAIFSNPEEVFLFKETLWGIKHFQAVTVFWLPFSPRWLESGWWDLVMVFITSPVTETVSRKRTRICSPCSKRLLALFKNQKETLLKAVVMPVRFGHRGKFWWFNDIGRTSFCPYSDSAERPFEVQIASCTRIHGKHQTVHFHPISPQNLHRIQSRHQLVFLAS